MLVRNLAAIGCRHGHAPSSPYPSRALRARASSSSARPTKRFAELERYDARRRHGPHRRRVREHRQGGARAVRAAHARHRGPRAAADLALGVRVALPRSAGRTSARKPTSARDALAIALAAERRAQNFYVDVAEHTDDDTMCAFAAEMAADESRHIARLERLLAREPDAAASSPARATSCRSSPN